jgi:hypothetical protein
MLRDQPSGPDCHLVRKTMIHHDGQMRSVLLGRADWDNNNRIVLRTLA